MSRVYPDSKICVIVIAYNAEKTIENLISDIPRDYVDEIYVGDDASQDNTFKVLESFILTVLFDKISAFILHFCIFNLFYKFR